MTYRRIPSSALAMLALIAVAASAIAQQAPTPKFGSANATRLVGQVATSAAPTPDAFVELLRAQTVLRSARTRADGRFEFDHLATGDYRVRVTRSGMSAQEQTVRLAGPADTIRFQLRDLAVASRDTAASREEKQLAKSTAPSRNWDCRVTDHEVHNAAILAYNRFLGSEAPAMLDSAHAYGIPFTRDGFFSDFRRVADPGECRRIASAIDKQYGLLAEQLRVFRIGKVYFFPDFGDGGMVVGLDGKVRAIYISQG